VDSDEYTNIIQHPFTDEKFYVKKHDVQELSDNIRSGMGSGVDIYEQVNTGLHELPKKFNGHINFVKVYIAFSHEEKAYVFYEYLEYGDLESYLKEKKRFSEKRTKNYISQLIDIYRHINSKNIIYIDFSLRNIMFADKEKLKIKVFTFR